MYYIRLFIIYYLYNIYTHLTKTINLKMSCPTPSRHLSSLRVLIRKLFIIFITNEINVILLIAEHLPVAEVTLASICLTLLLLLVSSH